jgi:excisionase family DNA binding protein
VEGNIFADHSLKIKEKGSLKGDINVKSFDLDFGASFEGSCRMKVMPASSGDEMSLDDVADYLNVDVKRVKSWVETHEIPAEDIDGHYIINMADLEEWVSKQPLEVK